MKDLVELIKTLTGDDLEEDLFLLDNLYSKTPNTGF